MITAAHCTDGNFAANLKIRAGSDFYITGGVLVQVQKIHQHKLFDNELIDFDFSILELASDLTFSQSIKAVGLPTPDEGVVADTLCFVSGWGNTQNALESRTKLRAAYVPVVKQTTCNLAYDIFGGLTDTMICAGYMRGQIDSCQGLLRKNNNCSLRRVYLMNIHIR